MTSTSLNRIKCIFLWQADDTLLDSHLLLDDQDLFGSMRGVIYLTARKNWMKSFEKQAQKEMLS